MKHSIKPNTLYLIVFLVISTSVYIYYGFEVTEYKEEYWLLLISWIYILILVIFFSVLSPIYIFEPVALITGLNIAVFSFMPMVNIITRNTSVIGFEVMSGCAKATWVYMISYTFFLLAYFSKSRWRIRAFSPMNIATETQNDKQLIICLAKTIWLVSFVLAMIDYVRNGFSLAYLLSFGMAGQVNTEVTSYSLFSLLANFRYSMIMAWLYLYVYDRKKPLTLVFGIITFTYFVMRGFRHTIITFILAPILYMMIPQRKTPKIKTLIMMFAVVVVIMGTVQFTRSALRSGSAVNWSDMDTSIFYESISGNFDIYKCFYGIVNAVPSQLSYQYGLETILSPFIMFIPRLIWAGKPKPPIIQYLHLFVGDYAAKAGFAMPYLSEYYLDGGLIGCIIGCTIFGLLMKKLKCSYTKHINGTHSYIAYAVLLPAMFQVVLRGYMPSNFFLLIAYSMPTILIRAAVRQKKNMSSREFL